MTLKQALINAMEADGDRPPRRNIYPNSHPPAGRAGGASTGGLAETPAARAAARTSPPVPAEHEAELAAMHAVLGELQPLSSPARARVIKWVEEVLGPRTDLMLADHQPATDEVDL